MATQDKDHLTGFFAGLTPEQKERALDYRGPDTIGDALEHLPPPPLPRLPPLPLPLPPLSIVLAFARQHGKSWVAERFFAFNRAAAAAQVEPDQVVQVVLDEADIVRDLLKQRARRAEQAQRDIIAALVAAGWPSPTMMRLHDYPDLVEFSWGAECEDYDADNFVKLSIMAPSPDGDDDEVVIEFKRGALRGEATLPGAATPAEISEAMDHVYFCLPPSMLSPAAIEEAASAAPFDAPAFPLDRVRDASAPLIEDESTPSRRW